MPYSTIAKSSHWFVVALFACGVVKQVDNVRQLEDSALLWFEIGFATLFLFILAIKYVYVTKTQRLALPPEAGRFQRMAARLVHLQHFGGIQTVKQTVKQMCLLTVTCTVSKWL